MRGSLLVSLYRRWSAEVNVHISLVSWSKDGKPDGVSQVARSS